MKVDIKKLLPIILFISVFVLIIGAFTFLRPQDIQERKSADKQYEQEVRIEDVPGVKNVKRFSDAAKNINRSISETTGETGEKVSSRVSKPLPYPRISINYSISRTDSIKNGTAEENSTFIIVTLDIRNYGYEYFDAYPKKFRLSYRDLEVMPIVTVSTGNMLDEVLPNSSRTKGDIVFLLDKKKAISEFPKIRYIDGSYTILYNKEGRWRRW